MKCSRVERILPLLAGGELEGRRKREIEEHLAGCEGCRLLHGDLLRGRASLASIPAPSLGEAESVELRRGVWREIESRGLRAGGAVPRYPRFAVASAAGLLVAVLVGLAVFSKGRSGPAVPLPAAAVPGAREETVAAVAPARTVEKAGESAGPEPVPAKARPLRARAGRHTGAIPPEVVKIEFQTANPDVRIIWLVKKSAENLSAAGRNQEAL
jgi:anti-sigma factor RsiW